MKNIEESATLFEELADDEAANISGGKTILGKFIRAHVSAAKDRVSAVKTIINPHGGSRNDAVQTLLTPFEWDATEKFIDSL